MVLRGKTAQSRHGNIVGMLPLKQARIDGLEQFDINSISFFNIYSFGILCVCGYFCQRNGNCAEIFHPEQRTKWWLDLCFNRVRLGFKWHFLPLGKILEKFNWFEIELGRSSDNSQRTKNSFRFVFLWSWSFVVITFNLLKLASSVLQYIQYNYNNNNNMWLQRNGLCNRY